MMLLSWNSPFYSAAVLVASIYVHPKWVVGQQSILSLRGTAKHEKLACKTSRTLATET